MSDHEITVRSPFHFGDITFKPEIGEYVIEGDERQLENLAETIDNVLNGPGGDYDDDGRGDDFDSELHDDLNSLFEEP